MNYTSVGKNDVHKMYKEQFRKDFEALTNWRIVYLMHPVMYAQILKWDAKYLDDVLIKNMDELTMTGRIGDAELRMNTFCQQDKAYCIQMGGTVLPSLTGLHIHSDKVWCVIEVSCDDILKYLQEWQAKQ